MIIKPIYIIAKEENKIETDEGVQKEPGDKTYSAVLLINKKHIKKT
jgi:hypothetical protein